MTGGDTQELMNACNSKSFEFTKPTVYFHEGFEKEPYRS